ncbi:MAG: 3-hydroxyacyl-CoA dehydrogenase family protein [Geminicoccaceae bacterium]
MAETHQIAVIGAGLMGHGIALTLARAGHRVAITDPSKDVLASAKAGMSASLSTLGADSGEITEVLNRIEVRNAAADAVKDAAFVFEAAPEKLPLKQAIFSDIEAHAPAAAILASNTSVIPITEIMQGLNHRERALGTHWWNPPHMIPLVEVVKTAWTDGDVVNAMMDLLRQVKKEPVLVEKDVPGFIGNRLQHALWREAISLVENGVCDAEAVDTVIKSSFGRRLAVLGPLENADLVGTDLTLDIHENVLFDLESRRGPSPFLKQLVADERLGMKSGEGFRTWTQDEATAARERVSRHLTLLDDILPD